MGSRLPPARCISNTSTGAAYKIYQETGFVLQNIDGANCPTAAIAFDADISVVKTVSSTNYTPGQPISYTVTVTNNSAMYDVNGIAVSDVMPAGLTNVTYQVSSLGTGATTNVTGTQTGNINDTVYLPKGTSIVYTVNATVLSTYTSPITNTASVDLPSNFNDTNAANNTSSVTSTTDVCYKPDLLAGVQYESHHGITSLGRAGAETSDRWPMVRIGAYTVLEANTKGFVINRMTTAQIGGITSPVVGMAVYDTTVNCLKINVDGTGSGWKCFNVQGCN